MAATLLPPTSDKVDDGLYRLSVEQYDAMIESGAIGEDDHVELLDGLLIQKMSQEGPHTIAIQSLARWLVRRCLETHDVRVQMPIRLGLNSRPEPDLAVVPGEPNDYPEQPTGEQVVLAVEVSDRASKRTLHDKVRLYAQGGVRELWIVDVQERRIEIHREPAENGYRVVTILAETEPFSPTFLSNGILRGSDILPRSVTTSAEPSPAT